MSPEEIEDRLAYWKDQLRLSNWEITLNLKDPPSSDDALAECCRATSYEQAEIRLAANWRDWTTGCCQLVNDDSSLPPTSLDRVLVHELLHCSFHDLDHAGRLEWGLVSRQVDELHESEFKRHLERTVERMALVIVGLHRVGA